MHKTAPLRIIHLTPDTLQTMPVHTSPVLSESYLTKDLSSRV